MKVEQFVMAYKIEQDRIRALLPEGFESLRPVLRINAEVRWLLSESDEQNSSLCDPEIYLEFNTPVSGRDKRGWLNIANWNSETTDFKYKKEDCTTTIESDFFSLTYTTVGIQGGCPAEKDNDGCFFLNDTPDFRPNETIAENKEFCDCEFAWKFNEGDAHGRSIGKTLPAFAEEAAAEYEPAELIAENAAAIPCQQVLGTYVVCFNR